MKDKSANEQSDAKSDKNALPANLDQLKNQLEQLAAERNAKPPDDPKNVAPRWRGR